MNLAQISYSLRCFILFHYTTAKFAIKKITTCKPLIFFMAIPPTILYILITLLIITIFGSYKAFVYLCLKIWYGKKFIKFIPACGTISSFHKKDYHHINFMARISTDLSGNELFDQINERVFEKFFITDLRNQLLCLCRRRMGYSFMISMRDVEIEEVFREIKTDKRQLTEDELQDYINKFFGSPMPRNDEMSFDIALCTTPIEDPTNNNPNMKSYAILFRFKHSVGDGLVLYHLLSNAFTKPNKATETYIENVTKSFEKVENLKKCSTHIVNMHLGQWCKRDLVFSGNTTSNVLFIARESNCLWKVKQIRKCFSGISFLNIIITAYTASLEQYIKKFHPDEMPKTINIGIPIQINQARIKRMLTEDSENDFDNDFSTYQVVCPIVMDHNNEKDTLIQRMLLIQNKFDEVFNSFDITATYILFNIYINLLPLPLITALVSRMFFGTMISCIPGGPKREMFNGTELNRPIFFVPLQHVMGIALGILTYADLLQVGFTLDGTKFDSQEKVDLLINSFFENINLLHEESIKRNENYAISRL